MSDIASLWQHVRNLHHRQNQLEELAKEASPALARAVTEMQAERQRVRRDGPDDRPESLQNVEDLRSTLVESIKAGSIPDSVKVDGDPGWSGPQVNS